MISLHSLFGVPKGGDAGVALNLRLARAVGAHPSDGPGEQHVPRGERLVRVDAEAKPSLLFLFSVESSQSYLSVHVG